MERRPVEGILWNEGTTFLWCQISGLMPGGPRAGDDSGDTSALAEDSVTFHVFLPFTHRSLSPADHDADRI